MSWSLVADSPVYGQSEVARAVPAAHQKAPLDAPQNTPQVARKNIPQATPQAPQKEAAETRPLLQAEEPRAQVELDETRAHLRETEGKQRDALEELRGIQEALALTSGQIEHTGERLIHIQTELVETQSKLSEAQARLTLDRKRLARRIVAARRSGDGGYLGVALGARDFQDFLQREEFISRVLRSDMELIRSVRERIAEVEAKEAEIERQRALQGELMASLNAQREAQTQDLARQKAVYDRLEGERSELEAMIARQERDSESVRSMLQPGNRASEELRGAEAEWTGGLILPVAGRMTSRFGRRFHPVLHVWKLHTGVDFGVPTGTAVHAAAGGVVVHSGWLGAYGNAVVIDHGGGVSTLYGHCSSLSVRTGQSVTAGEVISYSGSTGYSTGPHLHFEKRVNGSPVPPL